MNGMDRALKLLAAAEGTSAATTDMIECARSNAGLKYPDNISAGDTVDQLADSLRLPIECLPEMNEATAQLQGAVIRYLEPEIASLSAASQSDAPDGQRALPKEGR